VKIKELENRHEGSMAFVVGAGPSLHFIDVEPLKEYTVLAVNSGLPKVPFADYFVADDVGVKNWDYFVELLPTLDTVPLLYRDKLVRHTECLDRAQKEYIWFNHKWWWDAKNKRHNPDGLKLTKEATAPIIGARTTAGSAFHFAYIMGCNPIVLMGCDCCYYEDESLPVTDANRYKRYYWMMPGETPCKRVTNERVFSFPNRGVERGKPVDAHAVAFIEYWEALAKEAEAANIDVIDCSTGILDCFPKMTLDEILDKYGHLKK